MGSVGINTYCHIPNASSTPAGKAVHLFNPRTKQLIRLQFIHMYPDGLYDSVFY